MSKKMLVISEDEWEAVYRISRTLCSSDAKTMGALDCARAALASVEIPDGTKLAVVEDSDTKPPMLLTFEIVEGGYNFRIVDGYRRIIQEIE